MHNESFQYHGLDYVYLAFDVVPEKFDIIFADPPYDNFEVAKINGLSAFLKEAGVLVLSHPGDAPEIDALALQKTKAYANARVSIYVKLTSYHNK